MPAAGLAAQSGAPILFVTSAGVPAATAAELEQPGQAGDLHGRLHRDRRTRRSPSSRASARSRRAEAQLRRRRRRPPATRSPSRASPTARSAGACANPATASCSPTRRARSTRPPPRSCPPPATTRRCCCSKTPPACRRALSAYLSDIQPGLAALAAGQGRLQSRLADRRRTRDLGDHAGRTRRDARDRAARRPRPKNPPACPSNDPNVPPRPPLLHRQTPRRREPT